MSLITDDDLQDKNLPDIRYPTKNNDYIHNHYLYNLYEVLRQGERTHTHEAVEKLSTIVSCHHRMKAGRENRARQGVLPR